MKAVKRLRLSALVLKIVQNKSSKAQTDFFDAKQTSNIM